jgi:hypothetical protein
MTSTSKISVTPPITTSQFADGNGIDFVDFSTAFGQVDTVIDTAQERLSVSPTDTHVKHLNDALVTSAGLSKTIVNPAGDESLRIVLDSKLQGAISFLDTNGQLFVSGIDSQVAPANHVIVSDGAGGASWAAQGGGGAQPVDVQGVAGEILALRDLVFLASDGKFHKLDIDASPIKCGDVRGFVIQAGGIALNATGTIRVFGDVTGFSGLTPWGKVYANTTAGTITQTKPSPTLGGGQIALVEMGYAISATAIICNPDPVMYMQRLTLANNGTVTVEHQPDGQGFSRIARAFTSTTEATQLNENYASSNQDANFAVRRLSYSADLTSGGTATASNSSPAPSVPSAAFDNVTTTAWITTAGVTSGWLEYEFTSPQTIRQYRILAIPTGGTVNRAPQSWTFEYWNGTAWVVVDTRTAQAAWTVTETRTYQFTTIATSTRWRINVSANHGNTQLQITDLEMMSLVNTTAESLAQSFTFTSNTIENVRLWLRKVAAPTGTLTLRIETNNAGAPSGTLVDANATTTVTEASLATSYGWITFEFTNFALSTGTYWLVLSTSRAESATNYIEWGADTSSPAYAGGEMRQLWSTWDASNADACFEIYVQGTVFNEPCTVGRWAAGTRDVGVRYDNGSGGNLNTNTTFTNVMGASVDLTVVVECK